MIKQITFTVFLALAASIGFAQLPNIPFEKYGVAEGLPEEVVYTPLQDDKGFIWFGTQNGLVKYDGYHFKVYQQTLDKTDTTGFQLRNLNGGLLKGKDGKIWMGDGFGGAGGVSFFDPTTEKFRTFYPENKGGSLLLFEDEAGNIWFTSQSALTEAYSICRLNPISGEIKEYPLAKMNSGNQWLTKYGIAESSGTVWLLDDQQNLNRLNPQKDSFEIIIPAGKDLLLSGKADTLRSMSIGSANRLLLTGTHGLYIFDSKEQKIVNSYVYQAGNANTTANYTFGAVEDLKGQIWVTREEGSLSLIDPSANTVQTFTYGSSQLPLQKGIKEIAFFLPLPNNKNGIWFQALGTDFRPKFFVYYHFAKKSFTLYDYNFNLRDNPLPANPPPYFSLEDRTGILWLGTWPGLYKQAPKKQQMNLFRYRTDEPNSLPSDSIRYLFEDSKKRLWIGTHNGLAIYQAGQENFRVFRNNPANPASLSSNSITSIQEDADGKIWVGTLNGLNLWQESSESFKRFFYSPSEVNSIVFLYPDKQQRLWLSILDKGVFVLDKNTGNILKSFLPDDKDPASLSSNRIGVFYQDSRGNIWLGDGGEQFGLYRLNETEDGFKHYMTIPGDSSSISSNRIFFLIEDEKNRLWVGLNNPLSLYNDAEDQFIRFNTNGAVSGYAIDKNGEPWFGSYSGNGLASVDAEKRSVTFYGESKGLLHNDLRGGRNGEFAQDEFGRFWLPTQRGLSVFDPETKSFTSYFKKDGFQPYPRGYASIKTSNGDIWIGGQHGLNHIVPAKLLKNDTTVPSIVITQMSINDSLYSKPDGGIFKQSVAYTNAIELKHWQKNLGFDFVALHYLRSEDNLYSWKLENHDNNWSAPSKERKATYTNLSPGRYIFRVKASNADGVWNEEGTSLSIRIFPPWWLSWWAYGLYLILFIAGIWAVYRVQISRVKQKEREKAREKELEQAKEIEKAYENLKATQEQLVQQEKLASLGQLTAGIAHEIKNPLNFVNNFSEVSDEMIEELIEALNKGDIEESLALSKDIGANLKKIHEHGSRANGIVQSMLMHSRGGSGKMEPTDLNALIKEYVNLSFHGMRAGKEAIEVDIDLQLDENVGEVPLVAEDFSRVILNLCNNAFDAMRSKLIEKERAESGETYHPKLTVRTKSENGQVLIEIEDNGPGIPDEIKDKIMQPFFTTKKGTQGTGLGLSITNDIIKAHGGSLDIESSAKGSTFIIYIPK